MTRPQVTGYMRDVQGVYIEKDPEAELIYTLDWTDWLQTNDTIVSVTYAVTPTAAAQDIDIMESGVNIDVYTYVKLNKGIVNEVYTVTAEVTTDNGLVDRRSFRVKVKNRSL